MEKGAGQDSETALGWMTDLGGHSWQRDWRGRLEGNRRGA